MSTVPSSSPMSSDLMTTMNPSKKTAQSTSAAAQDRFMTLLVTQMKNQDPLNPLDNAQVTSQLAQLSTVTGIDKLNTTLEALQGSYQSSQSLQAASMIGHGVMAPGSKVNLTSGKALFGIDVTEPADNVNVTIRDASGKAVREIALGAQEVGMLPLAWDGATDSGKPAADGMYTFEVTATRAGQKSAATPLMFGQVASVSTGAQGLKLSLPNIGEVNFSDVRQIL
jgi:flagellar basal-body rod modification protein FlgD